MKDFSQYGEQAEILKALEGRPPALLWDIGAWHPTEFSNSRALIEMGWRGILVEPSPGPMLNLLAEYGDSAAVTLIQAAVGLQPGLAELWLSDDAVSTSSTDEHERWKAAAKFRGKATIPMVALEQLAAQYGGADFINLDVEGGSSELFLRGLQLGYRPHCWCIEHDQRTAELLTSATREGYVATLVNSTNVVLVRR